MSAKQSEKLSSTKDDNKCFSELKVSEKSNIKNYLNNNFVNNQNDKQFMKEILNNSQNTNIMNKKQEPVSINININNTEKQGEIIKAIEPNNYISNNTSIVNDQKFFYCKLNKNQEKYLQKAIESGEKIVYCSQCFGTDGNYLQNQYVEKQNVSYPLNFDYKNNIVEQNFVYQHNYNKKTNINDNDNNKQKELIKKEKDDDPNLKVVIISMKNTTNTIKIKINTTLEEFTNLVKQIFEISNITVMYYFNEHGSKKSIISEFDFKNSLKQNILKIYISNEIKEENPIKKNNLMVNNKALLPNQKNIQPLNKDIKDDIHIVDKFEVKEIIHYPAPDENCNNQIIYNGNLNNNIIFKKINYETNNPNNFLKEENLNVEYVKSKKKEIKEVMEHFASLSYIPAKINTGDIINSAVHVSDLMNQLNLIEKANEPNKFLDCDSILKYPGLISDEFTEKDKLFILALISKVLSEKGINVGIYKENNSGYNIDGVSLQYLFNGFTEKKKYEIQFNLGKKKDDILLQKGDELNDFIEEWKKKISNQLNIDKNEIFLVNPKDKLGLCLDMVTNEANVEYNKLKKNFKEIKNIEEKSLIEGCQLNTEIFEPKFNNKNQGWPKNETRANIEYKSPSGWFGYGLKVSKKYDNGNDLWLHYSNADGVFAIAYLGLSNIYGNKANLEHFLNEIKSQEVLKMGYEQTYKNDINIFDKPKNEYKKCGNGVYLFQDPNIAENTASIIDIGGVRYKILLMCRVNPKKIRQPQGFKDCWILNPTPAEVRPYRILIKKIFQSPMSGASQNEIKIFDSSPNYFKEIIQKKDITFLFKNQTKFNNDDFVINLYTSNDYKYINNFLREGKIDKNCKYNEKEIKSWVWCLHKALITRKSNVNNTSIFYRGVNRKFPELGVGSKFIFSEFTSVSEDKKVALNFACGKTLFVVRIEKNDFSHYYCYNIDKISQYPSEKEILITSNCTFHITKKEYDKKNSVEVIYLTCEGYQNK